MPNFTPTPNFTPRSDPEARIRCRWVNPVAALKSRGLAHESEGNRPIRANSCFFKNRSDLALATEHLPAPGQQAGDDPCPQKCRKPDGIEKLVFQSFPLRIARWDETCVFKTDCHY